MTCDFPKVFQYTFSCLVLWNRTNKQAIVCYRYANTQVLARADFVVIALKESTFVSNLKTAIAITIKINVFFFCVDLNFRSETQIQLQKNLKYYVCCKKAFRFPKLMFLTTTFKSTYKLHCLLGIILIAIRDEGITSVLTREGVHH